jgi:hypothetical protein
MKICEICKKNIPNHAFIDGKKRTLTTRKYCLECSPFGKHNTKKITSESLTDKRYCKLCENFLPKEAFGLYKRKEVNSYRTFPYCKKCDSNRVNLLQKEIKEKAVEYKGGKCEYCGYNKCLGSLHFHHKDPKEKDFGISQYKKLDYDKLKKELDKCILVCANCHGEIHEKIKKELIAELV